MNDKTPPEKPTWQTDKRMRKAYLFLICAAVNIGTLFMFGASVITLPLLILPWWLAKPYY